MWQDYQVFFSCFPEEIFVLTHRPLHRRRRPKDPSPVHLCDRHLRHCWRLLCETPEIYIESFKSYSIQICYQKISFQCSFMSFQQFQDVLLHNCVFVVSLTTAKLIITEIKQFRSTHLPLEIKRFSDKFLPFKPKPSLEQNSWYWVSILKDHKIIVSASIDGKQ